LALLSKTPAILLLPLSILFLLLANVKWVQQKWVVGIRPFIIQSLCWATSFGVTLFIAFPALWVSPMQVFNMLSGETNKHIGSALRPTFFMGQVAYEHGSLFYPVSLVFRLSPVVIVGVFLSFLLMVRWFRTAKPLNNPSLLTMMLLLSWSLLFVVGISFAEKKFDRYAVAVVPALIMVTAVTYGNVAKKWRQIVWPLVLIGQAVYLLLFLPYPLAAFNPLVGGAAVAEKVLPIGWGEAISASGDWLATLPGGEGKTTVSPIAPSLAPFFPGETLLFGAETIPQADYLIVTANSRQEASAAEIDEWTQGTILVHTIRFGGLEQAWIYERSNPELPHFPLELLDEPASFGGQVQLLASGTAVSAEHIDLFTQWQLLPGGENGRYLVKLTVEDKFGNQWQSVQNALLNETYFYPEHWQPGEMPMSHYRINLPLATPPASYSLSLSLLEEATGAQIPILAADGRFIGTTMPISNVSIPQRIDIINPSRLSIPILHHVDLVNGRLRLLGQDKLWETAVNGSDLPVDLYWQAVDKLPSDVSLQFKLGEFMWETPLSRYPSHNWGTGELIHEKYRVPIPPEISSGVYELSVTPFGLTSLADGNAPIFLGSVQINSLDRQFELPATIKTPLFYIFNNEIQLRGFEQIQTDVAPGGTLQVILYWQVLQKPDQIYSVFFHLLGPDGTTIVQADQWPGGLPSDLWVPGQVIADEYSVELPLDAAPGAYSVAVGLYRPQDGLRLPILDAEGNRLADDRIILPLE
ncbi:MAG: hypothetical protein GY943_20920, partial [Chloroflexi bacterium]|nr:hypothetical protein [Chloroflexota bacterium]